jgi:hypothetical protein
MVARGFDRRKKEETKTRPRVDAENGCCHISDACLPQAGNRENAEKKDENEG